MKILNFGFFKASKSKMAAKPPSRQDRKAIARAARALKLKRHLQGSAPVPSMGSSIPVSAVNTRQVRRRRTFIEAFNEITRKFSGEDRKMRRALARAQVRRLCDSSR